MTYFRAWLMMECPNSSAAFAFKFKTLRFLQLMTRSLDYANLVCGAHPEIGTAVYRDGLMGHARLDLAA